MIAEVQIYNELKDLLLNLGFDKADGTSDKVKTFALWRNQIQRESQEIPFLYPAVFVEFVRSNYNESCCKAYQQYDLMVRLHICYESYKTEDLDILTLNQEIYAKVQFVQQGYTGKLKRRGEEQDFDHPNIQDYIQEYDAGMVKDYGADKRPSTEATINTINLTIEVKEDL